MSDRRTPAAWENSRTAPAPWVLVAGGFHREGGMDKANAALAEYLLGRGTPLHLVAHRVDPGLSAHPGVTLHLVPRPLGSFFLGERRLERTGRAVARLVSARHRGARVVVNGGNCAWPDINWVHSVHRAWPCFDEGAPAWFKVKNRAVKLWARRREQRAVGAARLVVANSEQTRRHLVEQCRVKASFVRTVYLGAEAGATVATAAERSAARARLGVDDARPLVVFVGALSHDRNKGLDTLWRAWRSLCRDAGWDADLVVAGGGGGVAGWRAEVARHNLEGRVRLLGFTDRVDELLAAADLLVSPVRYEAYGLNVQEAICRGVPALVSATAGVAERYTPELAGMLLGDPDDADALAARLLGWRSRIDFWREQFGPLGRALRGYTWADMAREIVRVVEESDAARQPSRATSAGRMTSRGLEPLRSLPDGGSPE